MQYGIHKKEKRLHFGWSLASQKLSSYYIYITYIALPMLIAFFVFFNSHGWTQFESPL